MQPAFFEDGQALASTHYHVDAGFWKGDIFIDGATFLVPSKFPVAGWECYSVDLDDITGVYHVTLRKVSFQSTLSLASLSKAEFSSSVVEFSNGKMTAVPRVDCAATSPNRKARKIPSRDYQWDSSLVQPRPVRDIFRQIQFGMFGQDNEIDEIEPVRDKVTDYQASLAGTSVSTSHEVNSYGTFATLTGLDSSISGSGRVVGQRAADDQSSLSNFSQSILHIVPGNAAVSTSNEAEGFDCAAKAQKPVETSVDVPRSDNSSPSRRSSAGSQSSRISNSTVLTSPASPTFSTLPFWKSALANLPHVPVAPGKPNYVIEALGLEGPKHDDLEKTNDPDKTVIHRLSWNLRISYRQLRHWDEIQNGKSPCLEEVSAPRNGLAMTEEGYIVVTEDASHNVQSSLISPQSTSKHVEALPSLYADKTGFSQGFDALDVVRIELTGQNNSPLFPLDLAPEAKEKQRATDAPKSQLFPPVGDETDVEIAIDSASGKLYLRPKVNAPIMVIQTIPGTIDTSEVTGASGPTQGQPSGNSARQPTRLNDIDLTAEFNQGATDLDDEEVYSVPSTIDYHMIGRRLAKTQYIPSEYADYVENRIQAQPLVPRIVVEVNEYWNFIKATIDGTWHAQGCPKGFLPRRPFCENDSDAVFRELLGLGSKPEALVEKPQDLQVGFPVHHYNLIDQPVFQDSRNPSAVSYWAAMVSYWKKPITDGISWKAVVSSQAAKWVDPCTLDGGLEIPDDLRVAENSTALRDFLTGQTTIQYGPWGTWISDRYDPDQEIPEVMSAEFREAMSNASSGANTYQGLQRPYLIRPEDGDISVNDDGTATVYPSPKLKEEKKWETLESRGSTNLRLVDDGTRRVYSFKGMEESRVYEILEKYETEDILVVDLPMKVKPKNAVENISNEEDGYEIEDFSSEAETDIPDEIVLEREPVHYQGTLLITGAAAADSAEGAPEQPESFASNVQQHVSEKEALANNEEAAQEKPTLQAHTSTSLEIRASLATEKPAEHLEKELAKNGGEFAEKTASNEAPEPPKFSLKTLIGGGKDTIDMFGAQSHKFHSEITNEEDSDYESIARATFDDTDYSSTWSKRVKPEDHPKANDLARSADGAPYLLSKSKNSSRGPKAVSKSKQSQKQYWSRDTDAVPKSTQDQADLGRDGSSPLVYIEARYRLASWSSSPRRVMRGGCGHTFHVHPETEEIERHPDLDWDFMEMTPGRAELFNVTYTEEREIVDRVFDEYVANLFGSGALAQKMMSGQGIIPRTTSRMMTLLGPGAVQNMMKGNGISQATSGMVSFLGTGEVPQTSLVSRADFAETPQSPTISGRNLSPTKMLFSVIDQLGTPSQSPEAAENLGVWEDDGYGGFESPGKHRPPYMTKVVFSQGSYFDTDVDIFDSGTEEALAAAQGAFHHALVSANAKARSTVADRATNFLDKEAPSTPVRCKGGILSPIQENSQTPIGRVRAPPVHRIPWNPNFMRDSSRTVLSARKQALSMVDHAAAKTPSAESSQIHSRNTSFSSEAISTEDGSTHMRNTSISSISSSSSKAVSNENGNTHTRNTSLSETRSLEEEFNDERAMWEVVRCKGYAASRIAQFDSPVNVPLALEPAALGHVLASPSKQHEAKGHTSHYLLVVAIIVAFLWPFAG